MRGVKAKKLRRIAEALAVEDGQLARSYGKHKRRGNIVLHPKCARAVYQRLKKELK